MDEEGSDHRCCCCDTILEEPYISCAECRLPVLICLHCFARGFERGAHKNSHDFEIIQSNFALFPGSSWTAAEERKLLSAIAECGVGNWQDVANQLLTRSRHECEEHYTKFYLENRAPPLPVLPNPDVSYPPPPIVFKLCEDPPRLQDGTSTQLEHSGYMAARGDFHVEYGNFAEMDLKDVHFDVDDSDDDKDLKFAVINIYWNVLKERQRRKRIIRRYGLINLRKASRVHRGYEETLKPHVTGLVPFMRLLKPMEFDMYLEGLSYEKELRDDIMRLKEYHAAGIRKLRLVRIYNELKRRREERSQSQCLDDVLSSIQDERACQQWLQKQSYENLARGSGSSTAPRRGAPPLDISNLPGYDKLLEKEKEVCSNIRLVPEAYMEFKRILINECNKAGFLRLATARSLIKIDVNKTRKLFDFLVDEMIVNKDPLKGKSSEVS